MSQRISVFDAIALLSGRARAPGGRSAGPPCHKARLHSTATALRREAIDATAALVALMGTPADLELEQVLCSCLNDLRLYEGVRCVTDDLETLELLAAHSCFRSWSSWDQTRTQYMSMVFIPASCVQGHDYDETNGGLSAH